MNITIELLLMAKEKLPEIRQSQYWSVHLWPPSYYMSTLDNMSKDIVEDYSNNQKYNALQKKKNVQMDVE